MAMKKATKERITAAYEKGFEEGDKHGYERAKVVFDAMQASGLRKDRAVSAFADSLEAEADPE